MDSTFRQDSVPSCIRQDGWTAATGKHRMKRPTIHILDDDRVFAQLVAANLGKVGEFRIRVFSDPEEYLGHYEAELPDAVITDLMMPGISGIEVTRRLRSRARYLPIFVLTSANDIGSAIEALKAGANEYLTKPPNITGLQTLLRRALSERPLIEEALDLSEKRKVKFTASSILGTHPLVEETRRFVQRVADVPTATVMLLGESGTGKNLAAKTIHYQSDQADKRFVEMNCSAVPAALLESELFGHVKGSFTGAAESKRGLIEVADGGTLFLDEIGDLTLETQAKLLNFLEARRFRRLGGTDEIEVSLRVVTATNRDLENLIRKGKFREDLYYRIRVATHRLPALREIAEAIPELVDHFRDHFNGVFRKNVRTVAPRALDALQKWDWPGNVRELRNIIERAMIFADGPVLTLQDLPAFEKGLSRADVAAADDGLIIPADLTLALAEKEYIRLTLRRHDGNIQQAAESLGISRKNLWEKRRRYGLLDDTEGTHYPRITR
jgi:two-component system, NtrC family, response regulator AtoC